MGVSSGGCCLMVTLGWGDVRLDRCNGTGGVNEAFDLARGVSLRVQLRHGFEVELPTLVCNLKSFLSGIESALELDAVLGIEVIVFAAVVALPPPHYWHTGRGSASSGHS